MLDVFVGYAAYEARHEMVPTPDLQHKPAYIETYSLEEATHIPQLSALTPGFHHDIKIGENNYHVAVTGPLNNTKFITFDITDIERAEESVGLLIIMAAVLTVLLSSILIYWLSRNVIRPVTTLANEVANIDPNKRNVRIAQKFEDMEVSVIAKSFDRYMDRLDQFIEREQSFTSTASHELRTPLSIISTSAELLETKSDIPETSRPYLRHIRRSAQDMSDLITALLFLSRESDQSLPSKINEKINLKNITQQLIDDLCFIGDAKPENISIVNADESEVCALYSHIYIVIKNILSNAIKYGNNQPITVNIINNKLEISDSGPGIAENEYKNLYQKGYKGSTSQGNGLGLFIVKSFCDYYGWIINIKTSKQSGTTVSIDF